MPPKGAKRPRSSEQCLLTESLVRYIDGCELDGEVFELGGTFGIARAHRPVDFKMMAKLSEFIVAILRAAPEARLRRARISSCVREAIVLRPRRIIHPSYTIQYVGEMVSKQVLRVCVLCFVASTSSRTCVDARMYSYNKASMHVCTLPTECYFPTIATKHKTHTENLFRDPLADVA